MSLVTFLLFAAILLQPAEAQSAAERIQQAQYRAAVERRDRQREVERSAPVPAPAAREAQPPRDLSARERNELEEALDRLAQCSTRKLVYSPASGLYVPKAKKGCR